ncbi:hypothetical protein RIR_jg32902.t1 [Rhizophagus irregularis DAOM 181602=DAOM 197198]|nr:hypothetical protein RIR_jg32902.t1 [Rhizophagus irregularis DAOM 181602=DAOM 197198]
MSYISQLEHVLRYTKLSTTFTELFINDFEQSEVTESDTGIDDNDDSANNEYSEIFENYLCPPFEPSINTKVCYKLYNKQELENFNQDEDLTVTKCQHIEFPNLTSSTVK